MEAMSKRFWWIGAGALALIIALVAVALSRKPVELDPSTPGGVVQVYLQAVADEDYEVAFEQLHPDWVGDCTAADIAYAAPTDAFTATLLESITTGDTARVEVRLRFGASPGPFEPGDSGYSENFSVEMYEDAWLIAGHPWPYFEWRCEQP